VSPAIPAAREEFASTFEASLRRGGKLFVEGRFHLEDPLFLIQKTLRRAGAASCRLFPHDQRATATERVQL